MSTGMSWRPLPRGTMMFAPRGWEVSSGASSMGLRHVADDFGQLAWARPHRPVARREVDPGYVPQLGQAGKPRRVVLLRIGLDLVGAKPRADHRARYVAARVVRELHRFAHNSARHRDGPLAE